MQCDMVYSSMEGGRASDTMVSPTRKMVDPASEFGIIIGDAHVVKVL